MTIRRDSFTTYGWVVCVWVLVVSFQYGFHISTLNQIQAVLTCKVIDDSLPFHYGLPTCIPMTDTTFSIVTSVFTVGGLLGSSVANLVMDQWGRRGAVRASGLSVALGAGLMAISASIGPLLLGRFLCGVGAGFGLCVGPIYLSEMAPTNIKGRVGVLTQLSIVFGLFGTQAMGLQLATPTQWRLVLFFSSGLSVIQLLLSPLVVESPAWLSIRSLHEEQKAVARQLWGNSGVRHADPYSVDVEDPLLHESGAESTDTHQATVTIPQLFKAPELQRPLFIVTLSMTAQQVSGINAVMYYSNDILSKSLPEWGPYISLSITVVNVIMTAPAIFLIERIGRKPLLQLSFTGALVSLIGAGLGLNTGIMSLASIAILTFVTSFAVGLGPVPFVMIPEVSPIHAVSALSSVGLSLNWIANFCVGLVFLPLRNLLAGGDPMKEGRVFYVFAALLFTFAVALSRVYRG